MIITQNNFLDIESKLTHSPLKIKQKIEKNAVFAYNRNGEYSL
jgi:hypothetical protein